MKTFKEFNELDEGFLDSIKDIGSRLLSATGKGIVKVARGAGKAIGAFGGGLASGFRGANTGGGSGGGSGGNYRSEIDELKRKYNKLKNMKQQASTQEKPKQDAAQGSGQDAKDQGTQEKPKQDTKDQGTQEKPKQDETGLDTSDTEKEGTVTTKDNKQQISNSGKSAAQKQLEKDKKDATRTTIQHDTETGKKIAVTNRLGKKQSEVNADIKAKQAAKQKLGARIASVQNQQTGGTLKGTSPTTLQFINRDLARIKGADIRAGLSSNATERQRLIAAKAEAARKKIGSERAKAGQVMRAYESRDILKSILDFIG